MKLISMTDFVLEQYKTLNYENDHDNRSKAFARCMYYANFLKQPLTKGVEDYFENMNGVLLGYLIQMGFETIEDLSNNPISDIFDLTEKAIKEIGL